MPEPPVAGDDPAGEHQPPPEPRGSAGGASDAREADEHESHDPYQPL
jgi:hypothetical protein